MSVAIHNYDDLAERIDLDGAPPGWRVVCLLDMMAYGRITRHSLRHFRLAAQWWAVARTEVPDPPGDWVSQAACIGRRMFYVAHQAHHSRLSRDDREFEREALAVCSSCPVFEPCRAWALQPVEPAVDHVAGGLTPRQRYWYRVSGGEL